jgi:phosphoribosylformylglycinamidine synthase
MKRQLLKMHLLQKACFHYHSNLIKDRVMLMHGSGGLITTLLEMCFADVNLGRNFRLDFCRKRFDQNLFSENIELFFKLRR